MANIRRAVPKASSFESYSDYYLHSEYAQFPQEHRFGGSLGINLVDITQESHDVVEPALPEHVFVMARHPVREVAIDTAASRFTGPSETAAFCAYPARHVSRTCVGEAHRLAILSLPEVSTGRLFDEAGFREDPLLPHFERMTIQPAAMRLFDLMWAASAPQDGTDQSAMNALYLDGLTLQFLAALSGVSEPALSPVGLASPEDQRLARVIDYIEAYLGEALSIPDLAGIACLSAGHFSRTFKATFGEPVWAYVQRRRCERAKELLLTTRLPIAEIGYRCGFGSQPHLTNAFRKRFGKTPRAIRQGA